MCEAPKYGLNRLVLSLSLYILCLFQPNIYTQCITENSSEWVSIGSDAFVADLGNNVSVQLVVLTPDLITVVENVSTSTNLTSTDPTWYSENVAGNPSLQLRLVWDLLAESQLDDIDNPADDKGTGTIVITFSEPVNCPTLHLDRIGGAGSINSPVGVSNSVSWTVTTPGVTLEQPAGTGTDGFVVTPTSFFKQPNLPNTNSTSSGSLATQQATSGAAAGSVKLISATPITQVSFDWTGVGVEGIGADELEIAISGQPDCFPLAMLDKSVEDVRPLADGTFEVDYVYSIDNEGDTTLTQLSLIDDLDARLACAFQTIVGNPDITLQNNSGASILPTANQQFDGINQSNLFLGTDGLLQTGDRIDIRLTVLLNPDCPGVPAPLINIANLEGIDPFGNIIETTASDTLSIPRISLSKSADISALSTPVIPGDEITYSFEICNTGNSVLQNIQVSDPLLGLIMSSQPTSVTLGPGQCNSTAFSGLYAVQVQDLINGVLMNQATVTATAEDGSELTDLSDDPLDLQNVDLDADGDPDDVTTVLFDPSSSISILKTADLSLLQNPTTPGDEIIYRFEICNTGSLPLNNILITDPLVTVVGDAISLQPGTCNQTGFTGSYSVTQQDINGGVIPNTATVNAQSVNLEMVSAVSQVDVFLDMVPQVELRKRAITTNIQNPTAIGDEIIYEFEICNTGNVELFNVLVDDPLINISGLPLTLGVGACNSTNFIGNYIVTEQDLIDFTVTNSASVSATNSSGIIVTDFSDDPDSDLPGEDDPTITTLFECILATGQLSTVDDQCIFPNQTISISATQVTPNVMPDDFEVVYLLSVQESSQERIVAISQEPIFQISEAGVYGIYILIGELTDPTSSSFFNPSLIIPDITTVPDLGSLLLPSCSLLFFNDGFTVSEQPIAELIPSFTVCNSDELLMQTVVRFDDLFTDNPILGVWTEQSQNISTIDSFDFTGFAAGDYLFNFNSTSAVDPCVNIEASIVITVIDCFSECDELVCNEDVSISLGEDCFVVPTPDQLLESPAIGVYTFEYSFENGSLYSEDTIRNDVVGETLNYQISCAGNSCWGMLLVESNNIPTIEAPCACTENGLPNPDCILWCLDENEFPDLLISPEEYLAIYSRCGPPIIGELVITNNEVGDICDPNGIRRDITYQAKIELHGDIVDVDLLCQTYWEVKLDISGDDFDFFTQFGFPGDVQLDCEDVNQELSPEDIREITGLDSLSYPYYVDRHRILQDSAIVLDTQLVVVEEIIRDTTVMNENGEFVLITIQDKIVDTVVTEMKVPNGIALHPLVPIKDRTCNLLVNYADVAFSSCGSTFKILRSWTLIDWCDNAIERSSTQNIELIDEIEPYILDNSGNMIDSLPDVQVGIDPWVCTATVRLPVLDFGDNCDGSPQAVWITEHGGIGDGFATDLPLELSPITLQVFVQDDCGNTISKELVVHIKDNIAPVASVQSELLISLAFGNPGSNLGEAKIFATDLDEGSHDNGCGKVTLKTIRADDFEEQVFLCTGEFAGYEPSSSAAETELVDIGFTNEKGECVFDGTNRIELIREPADFVKFNCDDLDFDFEVILFVCDEAGNTSQASVNVLIAEESVPTLLCEDFELSCSDLEDGEDVEFEPPEIVGSACFNRFIQPRVASERRINGACGAAEIFVEWFLDMDNSGNPTFGDPMCTQVIQIETEGEILDPSTIKWPTSRTGETVRGMNIECDSLGVPREIFTEVTLPPALECVPDLNEMEGPVWCDSDCGIVGVSVETDTIISQESCLKLARNWTVIDWCLYNPNSNGNDIDIDDSFIAIEDWAQLECPTGDCIEFGPFTSEIIFFGSEPDTSAALFANPFFLDMDGFYNYTQIIDINDTTAPTIDLPDSIFVATDVSGMDVGSPGFCFGSRIVTVSGEDFCGGEIVANRLQWSVQVFNQEDELINDVVIQDPILGPSASTGNGSAGEIRLMIWRASDGCGNVSRDSTVIVFQDQEAPVPACVAALSTSFDSLNQMVAVWAEEFILSSYDNCSLEEDLTFSLVLPGAQVLRPDDTGFEDQQFIEFTCLSGGEVIDLNVWAWDESNNGMFCETSLFIQDSNEDCTIEDSSFALAGQIQSLKEQKMTDVQVKVDARLSEYPKSVLTNNNGVYRIEQNQALEQYTITPAFEDDMTNGVSTIDLVMLQQQILGINELESPYLILAGDANEDGTLTVADIVAWRNLILGIDKRSGLNSWYFIPKEFSFFDDTNPWPFATEIEIDPLIKHEEQLDFIGIKRGDLNNDLVIDGSETRNNLTLPLQYTSKIENNKLVLEFSLAHSLEVYGLQFRLLHPKNMFIDIKPGVIQIEADHLNKEEFKTALSWSDAKPRSILSGDVLFTMIFDADHMDMSIALSKDEMKAELYESLEETFELILEEKKHALESIPFPNPATDKVTIPFQLKSSSTINCRFYNTQGTLLYEHSALYQKGAHSLSVNKEQLQSKNSQIVLYSIDTGSQIHYGRISYILSN